MSGSVLRQFGAESINLDFQMANWRRWRSSVLRPGASKGSVRSHLQIAGAEQIAFGCFNEALVEHGVDAVFHACAVAGEVGALRALMAQCACFLVGDPNARQIVATE